MIALLALLGFAAQALPAQARLSGSGGAEVGSVEAKPVTVRVVAAVRSLPSPVKAYAAEEVPVWQTVESVRLAPTVRLRIDRSHE